MKYNPKVVKEYIMNKIGHPVSIVNYQPYLVENDKLFIEFEYVKIADFYKCDDDTKLKGFKNKKGGCIDLSYTGILREKKLKELFK